MSRFLKHSAATTVPFGGYLSSRTGGGGSPGCRAQNADMAAVGHEPDPAAPCSRATTRPSAIGYTEPTRQSQLATGGRGFSPRVDVLSSRRDTTTISNLRPRTRARQRSLRGAHGEKEGPEIPKG